MSQRHRVITRPGRTLIALSFTVLAAGPVTAQTASATGPQSPPSPTTASVLAAASAWDWRPIDPENTLYLELATGRVVIEMAPTFAPEHAKNVKALAREGYFDGLSIIRVQDNYVVQWGDAEGDSPTARREVRTAKTSLPPEFDRAIGADLPFTPSPDGDVYAPQTGWSMGFPAARDPKSGRTWLVHCYGALGTARGNDPTSGNGSQLFVVIGHSPRHLDRNDAVFGRVVKGIELLSTLPRGTGPLGFYEKPEQLVVIRSVKVAADVPAADRTPLQVLRTDTATFKSLIAARQTRLEEWFKNPTGRIEVCNVPIPVK